jgi:hypothetical protein
MQVGHKMRKTRGRPMSSIRHRMRWLHAYSPHMRAVTGEGQEISMITPTAWCLRGRGRDGVERGGKGK